MSTETQETKTETAAPAVEAQPKGKPKNMPPYLNPRFKPLLYTFDMFIGPRAGEEAPDFTVYDFDGNEVKLSDFRGKWVVIETGSATCSMYTKNIPHMKKIMEQNPDVEFLLIYVREAHPGERLGQHKTYEDKVEAAKLLKPKYDENRRILIDKLQGDFHKAYGGMPNVIYVIRPDGTVHYRCNWTVPEDLEKALDDRDNLHTYENADMEKLHAMRSIGIMIKTMWTGGIVALWDFVKAGPTLRKKHKIVDEYYAEHGRFKNSWEQRLEDESKEAAE